MTDAEVIVSPLHHDRSPGRNLRAMRPYAAVIFDMDGVIVDSEPLHEKAFQVVFEEMGYGSTHGFHFPDYYGRSDKALWLDFIARHAPPQPFDELMAWKQGRFMTLLEAAQPIFSPSRPWCLTSLNKPGWLWHRDPTTR